ncbi:MAG: alanine:cation symporter family protein [Planctomycetes bacterium]|nr:alanine:cation symporter family protein [Planctomycetota bacterium]
MLADLSELASKFVNIVWAPPLFLLLLGCGLIFSIATKFSQWRIMTHGLACLRGKYDDPKDPGAITHFQALCAALSATIGLGNIAGVAVAVSLGGPGAVFWMWVVGLLGMALKFAECSLAVMYRDIRDVPDPSAPALMEADAEARTLEYKGETPPEPGAPERARGEVRGGPMWYMQKALVEPLKAKGNPLWIVFKVLAVLFALSTMLNSVGGGNMFQGWNVSNVLKTSFGIPTYYSATVVSILVALVIIGGIRRIGEVASRLVPFMCVVYVLGALYVILSHVSEIPSYLSLIVTSAFKPTNAAGSFVGVSMWVAFSWGLKRACFSNEAGEGSAAMAHAAAKTNEPIREGVVAGMGPFIDTLVICTMSALVLLMTGAWNRPAVGAVASVSENEIVVTINGDVGSEFAESYGHELVEGVTLSVHVERTVGQGPVEVKMPIKSIDGAGAQDWSAITSITLDATMAEDGELSQVQEGMPVHLAVEGADMMRFAFDSRLWGLGKWIITLGVCLFAFSTMISWSYYGEKGAEYLFGPQAILIYKFVFIVFVFLGMMLPKFSTVYDFSDATTGLMVLCNLPAVLILMPKLMTAAKDYFRRLDDGTIKPLR